MKAKTLNLYTRLLDQARRVETGIAAAPHETAQLLREAAHRVEFAVKMNVRQMTAIRDASKALAAVNILVPQTQKWKVDFEEGPSAHDRRTVVVEAPTSAQARATVRAANFRAMVTRVSAQRK